MREGSKRILATEAIFCPTAPPPPCIGPMLKSLQMPVLLINDCCCHNSFFDQAKLKLAPPVLKS